MTTKPISIEVIDAAGGNIGSLCRALERLGVEYTLVNGDSLPTGEKPLILPGVGNFGAVMQRLRDAKLDIRIKEVARQGVPFLGICVGLQVLFDGSEESPGVDGLKLLEGEVVKFTDGKVPQIGWNNVDSRSPDWPSGFVYFVNSFYAVPTQPDVVLYQSDYFKPFCAAVKKDNITAFQFHPEKSGTFGISLLKHWLNKAAQWKPHVVAKRKTSTSGTEDVAAATAISGTDGAPRADAKTDASAAAKATLGTKAAAGTKVAPRTEVPKGTEATAGTEAAPGTKAAPGDKLSPAEEPQAVAQ